MLNFVRQHERDIHGVLSGFDRIRFRGTQRSVSFADGLFRYLNFLHVLLTAFRAFFDGTSRKLKAATEKLARSTPVGKVVYLAGNRDKQTVLDELIRRHAIPESRTGLLAVLSCVENCRSFELHRNGGTKKLELLSAFRKCLHYYLYIRHPRFGLMHIRLMTWFPLQVQVCLNGRDWLARQLDEAGLAYERRDNAILWVEDFQRAQALLDDQQKTDWPAMLSQLLRDFHPDFVALLNDLQLREYYWTAEQTEFATDVAFRSADALRPLYRRLLRHAIDHLSCADTIRFLQQKLTKAGTVHGRFQGEVTTDWKTRPEGTRVKHRLGANSVKMYDKFATVLRIETTIHRAEGLKVYRPKDSDPGKRFAWQPLRRSVADLYRRCELSQKANEAYLESLATVECPETLGELVRSVSRPRTKRGRRYRGLRVMQEWDNLALKAILRGEFTIAGFRNRDLRTVLFGDGRTTAEERRRQSGRVTRLLQLLQGHGLIRKVPKSHRYQITATGRNLATALSAAQNASLKTLSQAA